LFADYETKIQVKKGGMRKVSSIRDLMSRTDESYRKMAKNQRGMSRGDNELKTARRDDRTYRMIK